MKYLKLLVGLLFSLCASAAHAFSLNMDPNQSGAVTVSTSTVTPSQIFTSDLAATKSCVVNTSTNTVFFVGYSTSAASPTTTPGTFSLSTSTGSFSLPGSSTATFCFDGAIDPYRGPLWAVTQTGGNAIQRVRTH